jgi:hypothetical protein
VSGRAPARAVLGLAHYKTADFARLYAEARAYAEALPG